VQLECVNCTACIDECDTIMESVGLPKGLIRYASEDEIETKAKFKFTARMKGYTAILAILIGVLTGLLFLRSEVEATILRLPGQLYQHKGDNISNIYTFKIINKTNHDISNLHFKLVGIKGTLKVVGVQELKVLKHEMSSGTMFIEINKFLIESDRTKLEIDLYEGNKKIETTYTNFLSPRSFD
jgi:polyferredoxin